MQVPPNHFLFPGRSFALIAATVSALGFAGCERSLNTMAPVKAAASQPAGDQATMEASARALKYSKPLYMLGIVGYNYTETGIVDYSVNGHGAFNLAVSTETSGGGSTACCYGWAPATKLPVRIRIEWTRNQKVWCRKDVMLTDPGPIEPTTLEVHFYVDRRVEVVITDKYSPPRIKLKSAGGDYRVGKEFRKEEAESDRLDALGAECQVGEFLLNSPSSDKNTIAKQHPTSESGK
jgi:Protein of unknown function (DUF3304)